MCSYKPAKTDNLQELASTNLDGFTVIIKVFSIKNLSWRYLDDKMYEKQNIDKKWHQIKQWFWTARLVIFDCILKKTTLMAMAYNQTFKIAVPTN